MNYISFPTAQHAVDKIAQEFLIYSQLTHPVHISLSGGSTPKLLFKTLAKSPYAEQINWKNLHFWWGDDRMVPPSNPESNYGEVQKLLFDHIQIPAENIHRIRGENEPHFELKRFEEELSAVIPNGVFDWIILGMGADGHTASLFPHQTNFDDENLAVIAKHPESGQIRISKTAKLIEQAKRITYLVTGESKADILKEIQTTPAENLPYPAAKIKAKNGVTEWYLDKAAAKNLDVKMLLVKKYQDIFKETQEIIDALLSNSNLSKIHLGFVPDDFKKKKHRILIVGRETRGWDLKYLEKYDQNSVYQLMDLSKSWVIRNLERSDSVNKKGKCFFNFFRKVSQENPNASILWANIFCVSYKKSTPSKIDTKSVFANIKKISESLLKAQIEILQPNIIIFASGLDTQAILARRDYFKNDLKPSGKSVVPGLDKKYLEQFHFLENYGEDILCYRTVHPSSRTKNSVIALKELRKILKSKTMN